MFYLKFQIKAIEHDRQLNPEFYEKIKAVAPTQSVAPTVRNRVCRNLSSELNIESSKQSNSSDQIQITVKYAGSEAINIDPITLNVPINTYNRPTSNSNSIENRPIDQFLSYSEINRFDTKSFYSLDDFDLSEKSNDNKCSCNCKCNSTKKNNEERLLNLYFENETSNLLNSSPLVKKLKSKKRKKSNELLRKLYSILKTFNCYKSEAIRLFGERNQNLINVYNCLKTFEVYAEFVLYCEMSNSSSIKRTKQPSSTSPPDDGTTKKIKPSSEETVAGGSGDAAAAGTSRSSVIVASDTNPPMEKESAMIGGNKRGQKLKVIDNARPLVLPESKEDSNEKDFSELRLSLKLKKYLKIFFSVSVFAQNFMDKVEETFCQENREEKFLEFEDVLKTFDPVYETVAELFHVNMLIFFIAE